MASPVSGKWSAVEAHKREMQRTYDRMGCVTLFAIGGVVWLVRSAL